MALNGRRFGRLSTLFRPSAWYDGIDRAMESFGSAQAVTAADMIRMQNAAIRDAFAVTGNHLRQAMMEVSDTHDIYPEELQVDAQCRKMVEEKNVGA